MIAYLDCFAGASGDMILAALVDAGADLDAVRKQVSRLDVGPVEIAASTVHRCGIRAIQLEIRGGAGSVLRTHGDIRRLLESAGLDPPVEARATAILERLAQAEGRVHGCAPDEVRFHELGAVDTVVDVVGASVALEALGVERVAASPVATGRGMVDSAHGPLPVPAPAVLELLRGAPMYGREIEAELVTPTGAAILAGCAEGFGEMPPMTVGSVGYGAGSRELPIPNVVRCVLGEAAERAPAVEELLVEASVDDMSPELYEYATERLLAAGANDVWVVPVIGKRGRPAQVIQVLAPPFAEAAVIEVLLSETSSIGVRAIPVRKWMLEREWIEVAVDGGPVRVKIARRHGAVVNVAPEYADCAGAARRTGRPLKEIFQRAVAEAYRALG